MLAASNSGGGALAIILIVYLAVVVLFFVAGWKILTKAGYSGAWVFIQLVPLVNIVMFFVFAFSEWPILKELDRLRAGTSYPALYGGPPSVPPPPLPS